MRYESAGLQGLLLRNQRQSLQFPITQVLPCIEQDKLEYIEEQD